MVVDNVQLLAENLERQELQNATAGLPVPALTYTQLLAIYLYQNDLCNAKYLWKRIPDSVKSSSEELKHVWDVGQKIWQRDIPGIYVALAETWSNDVAEIMEALRVKLHQKAVNLVATAYSSIDVETLAVFLGVPAQEAQVQAAAAGWHVDTTAQIVFPCKPTPGPTNGVSCEEQLSKLTDFVSFLEN